MALIGLISAHDFSVQFDETRGEVCELGLDNVRRDLGDLIPEINGVRLTLHTLGEDEGSTEVRLDLDEAESVAQAVLDIVRKQRGA